jgi:3-methylcrotonyl-CoA carboxylase alpha subunit
MEFVYEYNGELFKIEIIKEKSDFIVKLGGRTYSLMEVQERSEGLFKFELNRRPFKCRVASSDDQRHIFINSKVYQLKKVPTKEAKLAANGKAKKGKGAAASGKITSPINGKIIRLWVDENTSVAAEQDLIIIEAMKMEHRIKSPFAGKVTKVLVKEGEQVELGTLLMELSKGSAKQEAA